MPKVRYTPDADDDIHDEVDPPTEKGPWRYQSDPKATDYTKRHFLESDDFTHDARLYITGAFANDAQRRAYGNMMAERLNQVCGEDPA
jgi:hypothetical protein